VRRDFLESLIQIIQRRGRTILISSHVLADVERVADRIGIMVGGVMQVDCATEHFKDSLRQVVLEFDQTPPAIPRMPGLVNTWTIGRRVELVIVNFGDTQRHTIDALGARTCDVLEMNLEDAFIAYTRGSRRALALFAE
jgi:ABC-2 type transport system ATP-binding protein